MKSSLLKKLCAIGLAAFMLAGTGAVEIGSFVGESVSVSAAEVTPARSFNYEENYDGEIAITKFKGSETKVVIPDNINGKKVTCIGERAFADCSITSVIIPDSITNIGEYAFDWCTNLTSIVVPDSVTSIGNSAFNWCDSLESVIISNNVKSIGGYTFADCRSLTSIAIPNGVTSIGECAFDSCYKLTSVTIPDSVTTMRNCFSEEF